MKTHFYSVQARCLAVLCTCLTMLCIGAYHSVQSSSSFPASSNVILNGTYTSKVFLQVGDTIVAEAENYQRQISRNGWKWIPNTDRNGFAGAAAMRVEPSTPKTIDLGYAQTSPELQYQIEFTTPGTYHVWVRGYADSYDSDSVHVGLNGQPVSSASNIYLRTRRAWQWRSPTPKWTIEVPTAGVHTINVWMREAGFNLDRLLLKKSGTPFVGVGPAESRTRESSTQAPTPTPTPTPTPSPTPTPFPTPSPTPTPSSTPTPTPTPTPTEDNGNADIVRFLEQATFGPTDELIARVQRSGFESFLEEQFNAPVSGYPDIPLKKKTPESNCGKGSSCYRENYTMYPLQRQFFHNALYAQDQLRQRVAFALTQILVVSGRDIKLSSFMVYYLKTIDRNSLGNYRQLLYEMTLNPAMGDYLDMMGNSKTNPNENYGRELLQLFSVGVDELNIDGTPKLNARGEPIPSYDQSTVTNFARVFTGWNLAPKLSPILFNYRDPMLFKAYHHDTDAKTLLNGVVLPANQSGEKDLNDALDNISRHPNVAPFISKQLIQHLVTSNPSPAYVARVAAVFERERDSPTQLKSVVKAILLDPEARGGVKTDPNYGRLREPVQFIANILRAFNVKSADGGAESDGHLNPECALMGQDVFRAPSVFNYYRPDTKAPGTDILGPQFGINTTATTIQRLNFVDKILFSGIAASTDAPLGTSLDLARFQSLAHDPASLVEALNKLLLHGTMPAQMRDKIRNAVASIPSSNLPLRARTAAFLIAGSPQYQVQK